MNFEHVIAAGLVNSGKKVSSKKILKDIGVYEDVSGTEVAVATNDGQYRENSDDYEDNDEDDSNEDDDDDIGNANTDGNDVQYVADFAFDDGGDDDDDDDDDDDGDSEDGNAVNDLQRNEQKKLLDVDVHELLKNVANTSQKTKKLEQIEDLPGFEDMPSYIDMNLKRGTRIDEAARKLTSVDKLLEKSVIKPGFEKQHAIPYETSEKRLRLERKKQRERTKGAKWFNMPAPEMTEEAKNDLMILQMRSVLDPKHFYKKNDLSVLPKYFQVGKVLDAPEDFYSSRIPKKQRKKTIVDELLADAEFKKYNKRRYLEIIEQKKRTHHKAHKKAQKLKRKGKKK